MALYLNPLDEKIVSLWKKFIPKQTYANRTGMHPNTTFGLTLAFDYATQIKDNSFKNAIVKASKTLFLNDT